MTKVFFPHWPFFPCNVCLLCLLSAPTFLIFAPLPLYCLLNFLPLLFQQDSHLLFVPVSHPYPFIPLCWNLITSSIPYWKQLLFPPTFSATLLGPVPLPQSCPSPSLAQLPSLSLTVTLFAVLSIPSSLCLDLYYSRLLLSFLSQLWNIWNAFCPIYTNISFNVFALSPALFTQLTRFPPPITHLIVWITTVPLVTQKPVPIIPWQFTFPLQVYCIFFLITSMHAQTSLIIWEVCWPLFF